MTSVNVLVTYPRRRGKVLNASRVLIACARECASLAPGHEPRSKLLAAVAERAIATADGFRAPDVVNMLWAYARWHRMAPGGAPG